MPAPRGLEDSSVSYLPVQQPEIAERKTALASWLEVPLGVGFLLYRPLTSMVLKLSVWIMRKIMTICFGQMLREDRLKIRRIHEQGKDAEKRACRSNPPSIAR